jgi:hypothetical protein
MLHCVAFGGFWGRLGDDFFFVIQDEGLDDVVGLAFSGSGIARFRVPGGRRFGHGPAGFTGLVAFQDKFGGFENDGRRGFGIGEDLHERFEGAVAEGLKSFAVAEGEFGALEIEGGFEPRDGFAPAVDGGAVDLVRIGGIA